MGYESVGIMGGSEYHTGMYGTAEATIGIPGLNDASEEFLYMAIGGT